MITTTTTTIVAPTAASTPQRKPRAPRASTSAAPAAPTSALRGSIAQEQLKWGLSVTGHAVATSSALPILANVLVASDGMDHVRLAATNLEIGISVRISAAIETQGGITLPAKLLADMTGSLPGEAIGLAVEDRTQTMQLRCARFAANIKGIEAGEFPTIPSVPAHKQPDAVLPPALLRELIDHVAYAAASEITRPVLAGVLLRLQGTAATFAAADGYRLSVRTVALPEPATVPIEVIIPRGAMIEIGRVMKAVDDEADVELHILANGGQVVFRTEQIEVATRTIEGRFPAFERVIPASYTTRAVLDRQALAKAIKLASYFAAASANILRLTLAPGTTGAQGTLTIAANAAQLGDNTGVVVGEVEGPGGQIALNARLVSETLSAIATPLIALEIQSPTTPGVFRPAKPGADGTVELVDGHIALIMPMTVR
jgi:DNA polymerase III subunit beta